MLQAKSYRELWVTSLSAFFFFLSALLVHFFHYSAVESTYAATTTSRKALRRELVDPARQLLSVRRQLQ